VSEKKKLLVFIFFTILREEEEEEKKNFFLSEVKPNGKRKRTIESSVPCNVMDVNSDMYGIDRSGFVESSYQVNDDISIPVYANVQLYPCSNCGRSFNTESLVDKNLD
jgi:hypothetical protein